MEKRLKTPDLFKFPFFEAICWFVAKNLLETLKGNPCFKRYTSICLFFSSSLMVETIILLLCEQRKLSKLENQTKFPFFFDVTLFLNQVLVNAAL